MKMARKMIGVACLGALVTIVSTNAADAKPRRHKVCKIVHDHGHPKRVCHWRR